MAEILARSIGEQFFNQQYKDEPLLTIRRKNNIPPPRENNAGS